MKTMTNSEVREFLALAKEHINLVLDNGPDPALHLHTAGVLVQHSLEAVYEKEDEQVEFEKQIGVPAVIVGDVPNARAVKDDHPDDDDPGQWREDVRAALIGWMEEKSLSQSKAADLLGVSDSTVSRIRNRKRVGDESVATVAYSLDVYIPSGVEDPS